MGDGDFLFIYGPKNYFLMSPKCFTLAKEKPKPEEKPIPTFDYGESGSFPTWALKAIKQAETGYIPVDRMKIFEQDGNPEFILMGNFTSQELRLRAGEFLIEANDPKNSREFIDYCRFAHSVIQHHLDNN